MGPRVLLTGGAGYIGSHCAVALIEAGYDIAVLDTFARSSPVAAERVTELTGTQFPVHQVDIRDLDRLTAVLREGAFDAVIHLAGLKAVGESVADPLAYYDVNVGGTVSLLSAMAAAGTDTIVFSSSATVYGSADTMPLTEGTPAGIGIANPYGQTKYVCEQIIGDTTVADPGLQAVVLRYFNPIGAHPSGRIGEHPLGPPANLLPMVTQVATGHREKLTIHGDDYPTPDGTGVRDYIHVQDLAQGHVAALAAARPGLQTFNLGTGTGTSVLELIDTFERVTGQHVNRTVGPRRPGDEPVSYTDPAKAQAELGWRAKLTVADACADAWRWQSANPTGYPQ